jgi:hypothetical protein
MFDIHNAKPSFSKRGGGALLHMNVPRLPAEISFGGLTWSSKSEYHVTLLGRAMLDAIRDDAGSLDLDRIEGAIGRARRNVPFRIHTRFELWRVEEDEKRSVIQMCEVDGAETFYGRLEDSLGIRIERPPLHVTIFTAGARKGIGIATVAMLHQLGRQLEEREVAELREALRK